MAPACVAACPEGAIAIEIVDIEEWRRDYLSANAPGLPSADDSISTTRVTLPRNLLPDTGRVDTQRIVPEHPHWPLVFMLVLSQLAVGAFGALSALDLFDRGAVRLISVLGSLELAGLRLGTAAETTAGMGPAQMRVVAELIVRTLKARSDEGEIAAVRSEVAALCAAYPPYRDL